jgi:1-acyl-sn-glycerol-3-phosphate acyltransferase
MFAIIAMMLPKVRYVAKYEIQYNPIFFLVGHLTGQIFINRQNSAKAVEKLKKTYHKVKREGLSLFIAPEGTRKHDSIVGVFKKGAFHTAKDLKYPIIPIYIDGAFTLCPGDHLLALPGEIVLRYYPPISTENWDDAKMNAEMARLESFYRDLYRETFKRQGLDLPV